MDSRLNPQATEFVPPPPKSLRQGLKAESEDWLEQGPENDEELEEIEACEEWVSTLAYLEELEREQEELLCFVIDQSSQSATELTAAEEQIAQQLSKVQLQTEMAHWGARTPSIESAA